MRTLILSLFSLMVYSSTFGQTVILDYEERTRENTAAIHIMEAKQTIENEEFEDIIEAKTKLVRIIENYRSDGYVVVSSNVSTHKHGRGYHYHYQYIIQKIPAFERLGVDKGDAQETRRELRQQMIERRREGGTTGDGQRARQGGGQQGAQQRAKEEQRRQRAVEEEQQEGQQGGSTQQSSPSDGDDTTQGRQQIAPNGGASIAPKRD
jgi:hypothetical protein